MFGLGGPEIVIILVVALLLFGPRRLPEMGRSIGQAIREFQKGAKNIREEFDGAVNAKEITEVKEEIANLEKKD
jgi:sec-independent protein translocase protein TatA